MHFKLLIFISVPKTYTKELICEPIGSKAFMAIKDAFSLTLHQSVTVLHIFTLKYDFYEL